MAFFNIRGRRGSPYEVYCLNATQICCITCSILQPPNSQTTSLTRRLYIIMSVGRECIECDMDHNEYVKFCEHLGVDFIGEGGDPLLIRIKDELTS